MDRPEEPARMDTVSEETAKLRGLGYELEADVRSGQVHLRIDGDWVAAPHAAVDHVMRYEGTSDPGDEMIVLAIHDPDTDRRGVLVSAYGSDTEPETATCLRELINHRGQ